MELYEVKYVRTIEGRMFIHANSIADAQKKVAVELACGTAPYDVATNDFQSVEVKAKKE